MLLPGILCEWLVQLGVRSDLPIGEAEDMANRKGEEHIYREVHFPGGPRCMETPLPKEVVALFNRLEVN